MKPLLAILLCISIPMLVLAADSSYQVRYDGGSVPGVEPGEALKLFVEQNRIRLVKGKRDIALIPASAVREIRALTALGKAKRHFVGLTWTDGEGEEGSFALQCNKNNCGGVLIELEAITGKNTVDIETAAQPRDTVLHVSG